MGFIMSPPTEVEAGHIAFGADPVGIHCPQNEGQAGHIAFGVDPVDIHIASCLHSYLLNQWVDFDQTCIDTLLGGGKEMIRFW